MQNKNSKSEGYIIREAENIIEKYLSNRELGDMKKYNQLRAKYRKLKILNYAITITFLIGMTLSIIL